MAGRAALRYAAPERLASAAAHQVGVDGRRRSAWTAAGQQAGQKGGGDAGRREQRGNNVKRPRAGGGQDTTQV
ncbi:MAG: hypothetical protein ACRDJN_06390 [Chloroflexota bacterium]